MAQTAQSYDLSLGSSYSGIHAHGPLTQLAGVQSPPLALSAISANSLVKLSKGNDVWAMALVNFVEQVTSPPVPELNALLQEFEDMFTKPNTLPPIQVYDHTIPLLLWLFL